MSDQDDDDAPPPEPIAGVFTPLAQAVTVPPQWVIRDLIPVGLTVIGAPPKSLKSTFTMAISTLIAGMKTDVLPNGMRAADTHGTVVGFSAEATAGELRHICEEGLGVDLPDDDSILIADDPWLFQLDDETGLAKLLFWLRELKPKLAFIDPFAEFHSLEEKDAREMIRCLRPLHRHAKENEMAVVVVHHTRKKGDQEKQGAYTANDLRGSSAIFGKMDGVLIFTPHEDQPGLLTIDAKFKRGRSWKKDIQFAAHGEKGSGAVIATEVIDDVAKSVLGCLRGGVHRFDDIARQCRIGKKRVVEAVEMLVRVGRVARIGRELQVMRRKG